MVFSTRNSIFFFYTTLVLLLSTQIHARENYLFGKFQRESPKDQNPNNVVEESFPNKKEQEHDPTFFPESENSYGLYGHDETTYNTNNDYKDEFKNNNNKYNDKLNGETYSTPSLRETEESYNNYEEKYPKKTESYKNEEFNNKYYDDEFNNNKKYNDKVKEETFSTPSLSETEESFNNYEEKYPKKTERYNNEEFNNKKYYNDEFNNNKYDEESFSENNEEDNKRSFDNSNTYGTELERERPYKVERQGMSDTRFMEKGNYYYDLYNDRNHGHYYRKPHNKSPAGYYYNKNNEENDFKDPYDSKWEKNMMNEQPEEFVEEQVTNQFKP